MRLDPIYEIGEHEVRVSCTECGELAVLEASPHAVQLATTAAEAEWAVHMRTYHPSLALLLAADPEGPVGVSS